MTSANTTGTSNTSTATAASPAVATSNDNKKAARGAANFKGPVDDGTSDEEVTAKHHEAVRHAVNGMVVTDDVETAKAAAASNNLDGNAPKPSTAESWHRAAMLDKQHENEATHNAAFSGKASSMLSTQVDPELGSKLFAQNYKAGSDDDVRKQAEDAIKAAGIFKQVANT